ncbi:hypothetical protein NHH73_08325 [Oxalobacteraceae bacterium OTU3CINTB1]|nr:hypothetical protein NHH73_08325 [Oxalobacteraceae bacterium OTU3CINTB1]
MAIVNISHAKDDDGSPGIARRALGRWLAALAMLALCGAPLHAGAVDSYTLDFNFSRPNYRDRHALQVLQAALKASSAKYGPYELSVSPMVMERDRLVLEMVRGKLVNLSAQISSPEWERKLIPIRVPIDKGLSSYRISLINGSRQAQFDAITSVSQLKAFSLGAGRQWSSTAVFSGAGFDVVPGNSTDNLHSMLAANRFVHFPRGVDEVVFEYDSHVAAFPALAIESGMVVYMPLPRYFFVAPGHKRLAQRLEYGLNLLVADGSFDKMFHQAYDGVIEKVALRKRRVFKLHNPLLSPETPLAHKAYWYDPFAQK